MRFFGSFVHGAISVESDRFWWEKYSSAVFQERKRGEFGAEQNFRLTKPSNLVRWPQAI